MKVTVTDQKRTTARKKRMERRYITKRAKVHVRKNIQTFTIHGATFKASIKDKRTMMKKLATLVKDIDHVKNMIANTSE